MISRYDRWKAKASAAAKALNGDGCTASPDFAYTACCDEHDVAYRTGKDLNGKPITRYQADKRLYKCMKRAGITPVMGKWIVPQIYFWAVRLFGKGNWKGGSSNEPDTT